jgi:chromosome segregation ATPase
MEEQIAALQTQITELTNQLKAANEKAGEVDTLVTKARKEEKEKLYGEITKFKELVTASEAKVKELEQSLANKGAEGNEEMKTQLAAKEAEVAGLNKQIEELNTKLAEGANGTMTKEEMDKLLASQADMLKLINEQNEKIATIEAEKQKEIAAKEVAKYKSEKLRGLDESFHPFVQGDTKEAVDASFESAKTAYEAFLKKNGYQPLKPHSLSTEEALKEMSPQEMREMAQKNPKAWGEYRKTLKEKGVLK